MKVEILIPQDHSNTFCNNKKSLTHLIQADSSLSYSNGKIKINGDDFPITINVLDAKNSKHKCFHIIISGDDSKIKNLSKLRRTLLILLNKAFGSEPQVIWDDIDSYYSAKAYLPLNEIENLMRKFLTQFLLINVGIEWTKETTPEDIQTKVSNRKRSTTHNYLSGTDFIDLKNFLFTKYTKYTKEEIFKRVSLSSTESDIQEIKSMLPRSNWDRYFKEHIECDENTLNSKWFELYNLRNQVAHNAPFSLSDYEKVESLVNFVKPIITSSIEKLSIINITESEKEELEQADIYLDNRLQQTIAWNSRNNTISFLDLFKRNAIREPRTSIINDEIHGINNEILNKAWEALGKNIKLSGQKNETNDDDDDDDDAVTLDS
ncbi:hypothetical protein SMQC19_09340 [Serratia marcescens]|nr:hypothetical protein SMQC19_09340 [Serratia marcescens]